MLCCIGLLAGTAVGQALGGPWTVVAPAAGFGLGFLADMKLMKGMHGGHKAPGAPKAPELAADVRPGQELRPARLAPTPQEPGPA